MTTNTATLDSLRTALENLSNSGTIHYEVTAKEYSDTRAAILKLEGVSIEEFSDYAAKVQISSKLDAEIAGLRQERENAYLSLLKIKAQLSDKTAELAAMEAKQEESVAVPEAEE